MPVYKVFIYCTTVGDILVDAPDEEAAERIAMEISSEKYKEEVDDTWYKVSQVSDPQSLKGRIIDYQDQHGEIQYYNYGEQPSPDK